MYDGYLIQIHNTVIPGRLDEHIIIKNIAEIARMTTANQQKIKRASRDSYLVVMSKNKRNSHPTHFKPKKPNFWPNQSYE